jgi:hypothetical protein
LAFIFLLPWLVTYLWNRFDPWIFVHIDSVILVSRALRNLILLKGLIDGIMNRLTMLF